MQGTSSRVFIERHFKLCFWLILVAGLGLSVLYASNQVLTGDQTQMLYKGYLGAYQGEWLSYGNAASGVGDVPGSLSAYIIGLPLMIWDSPWSPMLLLLVLHVVSYFLFDSVIKKAFNNQLRLVFLVLYWLSPWLLFESLLYNPSYLFFCTALHFWTAFNMAEKKSFLLTFLHGLSIGFAMQLHYSWPVLCVISAFLWYKNIIKISWFGVFAVAATVLASLVPYINDMFFEDNMQWHAGDKDGKGYFGWGAVHVYPIIKAVLYWLRYASFIFVNKLVTAASFDWLSSAEMVQNIARYIWLGIVYVIGLASLVISVKANYFVWMKVKSGLFVRQLKGPVSKKEWLLFYVAGAFMGVLLSAMLSPILFRYWHLILLFPIALLPLLFYIEEKWDLSSRASQSLLCAVLIYFGFVNFLAAHDSEKFSYKYDYVEQVNALGYEKNPEIKAGDLLD